MRILVTGAAGFIGSVTAEALLDQGHDVLALDDLSSGTRLNIPSRATFIEGDCGDAESLRSLGHLDACVHFAGRIEPAASMAEPEIFFEHNVARSLALVRTLIEVGCPRFVFSSSCAVYGNIVELPIDESHAIKPHSPYGETKWMVEKALSWLARQGRIRCASLRYFNAAGATAEHPERHKPETHLIPLALQAAVGERPFLEVFGDDYPTADGSCVRDYVHVTDLADAHLKAIHALAERSDFVVNLGTGVGSSIFEVVNTVKAITGSTFDVRIAPRRPGDPAAAVASNARALEVLGWRPVHSDLRSVITDAWTFRERNGDS